MTAQHSPAAHKPTAWVGWIVFTAAMMLMLGVFNAINGLAAIFADDIFVTGSRGAVMFDVTTWGWIHLVVGVLVAVSGVFLMQGATWARVVAVGVVMLNMLAQLLFLPASQNGDVSSLVDDVVLGLLELHEGPLLVMDLRVAPEAAGVRGPIAYEQDEDATGVGWGSSGSGAVGHARPFAGRRDSVPYAASSEFSALLARGPSTSTAALAARRSCVSKGGRSEGSSRCTMSMATAQS